MNLNLKIRHIVIQLFLLLQLSVKSKNNRPHLPRPFFFVLDITYRLMIMMAGVPIPLITISKDRLFCRVPCEIMF